MTIRTLLLGVALLHTTMFAAGDCIARAITSAPPTVYEASTMSPQNMDYDAVNKMFIAHSGWLNDKLVHYYKFRIFAPSTYPGVIAPGASSEAVPTQKIYIVTKDGTLGGAIGDPIIQYHHEDGTSYSDFMEIHFVTAPENYEANTFKSEEDILSSLAAKVSSGIMLNLPVVPTDSTLQDPHNGGTEKAPIAPVKVWYKCVEVWTYVFEVNDQAAADFFASTRTEDPDDFAFAIPVVPFATSGSVSAIPLWHVNQYSRGVVDGENGGGPSPKGMRNIINLDRADPGYSPLWSINWVTALPINYLADEVSNPVDITPANGFDTFMTPMFVNCPDIGNVGTETNPLMTTEHETSIDIANESNWIMGTDKTLIFKPDILVSFHTDDGTEIDSTFTNMMGAYELELMSDLIPEGTTEILVISDGNTIRTVPVEGGADQTMLGADDPSDAGRTSLAFATIAVALASIAAAL